MSEVLVTLFLDTIAFGFCLCIFNVTLNWVVTTAKDAMNKTMPQMKVDSFVKENGYSWTYVFVYKVLEEDDNSPLSADQIKYSLREVIDRLIYADMDVSCFYSCQRDEVYIKVRANPEILLKTAADEDYKLRLDSDRLRVRVQIGKTQGKKVTWAPINLTDEYNQSNYKPYEFIYGKYDRKADVQSLYEVVDGKGKAPFFRGVDRIKLMKSIFENTVSEGGAGLNIQKMLETGKPHLLAIFPLHDYNELSALQNEWLILYDWPSQQPFTKIRNYFGEKLALFYVFLGHYTTMLGWPSIIGMGIYAVQKVFQNDKGEHISMPIFAVYMCVWSTFMTEFWKGQQARHAMEWSVLFVDYIFIFFSSAATLILLALHHVIIGRGVSGFEDEEQDRPTFFGYNIKSPINGEDYLYYPPKEANFRKSVALTVVAVCILGVFFCVLCVFAFQVWVNQPANKAMLTFAGIETGSIIYSILNAAVIIILNANFSTVAIYMNDYENHRTDTIYEDMLISKIFIFQLVNSYASLVYISFFKNLAGLECTENSCTKEVSSTLSSLFISRLLAANLAGVILPKLSLRKRQKEESAGLEPGKKPTPIEEQYALDDFLPTTLLTDYAQLIIQFGYVSLFVATFPLAPLMAYVSNYIAIRIGCWKLCQIYRRPEPRTAEDIGTWGDMLELISFLSVIFNLGLVFVTGEYFINYTWTTRWLLFLGAEHFAFLLKYIVSEVIPDEPEDVAMQLERQEFLISKVIDNKPDDDDGELDLSAKAHTTIIISETDGDWEDMDDVDNEDSEEMGDVKTIDASGIEMTESKQK